MKLNEQDTEFFKNISQTETGRYFADYCKRVIDYIHDSRSWDEGDSKESSRLAAKKIQELIVEKIRPTQKNIQVVGEFE